MVKRDCAKMRWWAQLQLTGSSNRPDNIDTDKANIALPLLSLFDELVNSSQFGYLTYMCVCCAVFTSCHIYNFVIRVVGFRRNLFLWCFNQKFNSWRYISQSGLEYSLWNEKTLVVELFDEKFNRRRSRVVDLHVCTFTHDKMWVRTHTARRCMPSWKANG